MAWLPSLDAALFRFINQSLANPVFDWIMPFLSGNRLFYPALVLLVIALIWKGGRRARIFVFLLLVTLAVGELFINKTLKETVARPRPFNDITDARVLVGRGGSGSLPSSHAANWFAATMVAFMFYRRSARLLLPLAAAVAFSRVYNGVHYPGDVLAGAIIGAGYAAGAVWTAENLWRWAGSKWFPRWWEKMPSLLSPDEPWPASPAASGAAAVGGQPAATDSHWLGLGYLFIALSLFIRLAYQAGGVIELSEDEAYQWLWSKHLALAYYSKPPMIAYTQFLGTAIWGDTAFGVRFFSPVIAAVLGGMLLRFFAREVNARAGFWLLLIITATPLLAVGATLMTIDPLSVLFWTAAMISAWRALLLDSTRHWLWTGLWLGLGFLSKATALFQLVSFALFFVLWPSARVQLRRRGPWLALLIAAVCALPVLIWNYQNGWPTVSHLASRAGLDQQWNPTLRFFKNFTFVEVILLNPVFFVAMLWAMAAFWRRGRANALLVYLFSLGAPVLFGYWLYTLRARVQPNWIAPAVLPLFCLMVIWWEARWREGLRAVKAWLTAGLGLGLTGVVLLHETNLIAKLTGSFLPEGRDPLYRVRGWSELARIVEGERQKLRGEGRPVFIIGAHYGVSGLLSFYLPAAQKSLPASPLVYYQSSAEPENQFYFWPRYRYQDFRRGQNAIYVQETPRDSIPKPPPKRLRDEFASVTDLGAFDVTYRGQVAHTVRLYACRELR